MELVFGVVELLERVLGEAFVFIGVGQRDGGYALMPVSTVDQFVEFGQSVFEVVETAHALHRLLPLFDGNFEGHGSIAALQPSRLPLCCCVVDDAYGCVNKACQRFSCP